jgi:hypothetical protein
MPRATSIYLKLLALSCFLFVISTRLGFLAVLVAHHASALIRSSFGVILGNSARRSVGLGETPSLLPTAMDMVLTVA